jgi:haloacetate dehalogenase
MWRHLLPFLDGAFTVVCPDLRGYGNSGCPASSIDHFPYSKRAMAQDLVTVMERMGFRRFSVAGHDRGGRVAYRMAIDHAEHVEKLAVLDVVPTETAWSRADARLAMAFWPWSLLAQPAPLPERILERAAEALIDNALTQWGTPETVFPAEVRAAYVKSLGSLDHAHAICEEYRAAATIDREHDRADLAAGRRIACPVLALWSAEGGLSSWYEEEGGPLALWRQWCDDVRGRPVDAGHFFPEELPEQIAEELARFFATTDQGRRRQAPRPT